MSLVVVQLHNACSQCPFHESRLSHLAFCLTQLPSALLSVQGCPRDALPFRLLV